jgi:hypothetical protein
MTISTLIYSTAGHSHTPQPDETSKQTDDWTGLALNQDLISVSIQGGIELTGIR